MQQCEQVRWEAVSYIEWPVCKLDSLLCHYMTEKTVLTLAFSLWHFGKCSWQKSDVFLEGIISLGFFFFPVAGQIKLSCFAEGKGIIYYSLLLKLVSSAAYANLIGRIEKNDFNSLGWMMMSNFCL